MSPLALLAHTGTDHVSYIAAAVTAVVVFAAIWWRDPARRPWRLASSTAGVALVLLASSPWFERLAERSFTGHMVQHLLVIILAAPLFVFAQPIHQLMRSGVVRSTALGRRTGTWWRSAAPIVAPVLFLSILFATHLTAIYDEALQHRWIHELEHAGYLLGSLALWSAVMATGRSSAPARIGAVFGIIAGSALLAVILMTAQDPLVPTYEHHLGADEAVSDQRSAAALMWVSGMATTLPLMVASVWRWAATEERIARRRESLLDQGLG